MVLRQISEKIRIQDVPGIQSIDFSLASGGALAGNEGRVAFYLEASSPDDYRILDGRCFALTSGLTHSREGTKFSPVEIGVLPDGSVVTATLNFEGGFQRTFRLNKYDGTTGALLATAAPEPIVLGEQMRLTVDQITGQAVAQGWQRTFDGEEVQVRFDSGFSTFTVSGGQNNGDPFVITTPIVYSPIGKIVSVYKASVSTLVPGNFVAVQTPSPGIGTLFTQTNAIAAASSTYRDGPASIGIDPVTGDYIFVSQFQTSNISFAHDIQISRFSMPLDASPVLIAGPTTIHSSLPPDPTHTGLQAGLEMIVRDNQNLIIVLESLDYDGISAVPNSLLLVVDPSFSVLETIDLGAPGKVRITERAGRLYVLHQEATADSHIYLTTFYDDTEALPPHALKLTDKVSGNRDFAESATVSYEFGSYTASKYLLSETQSTNPNDTNHPGFFITAIPSLSLGGGGLRTVYAWFTNPTTSLFPNFATIFIGNEVAWTYVLRPGNNMISPAISTIPGLTAKDVVSNSPADFFFYENNGNLSLQFGNFIHSNPSNPAINIPMNPGVGYIAVLNSTFAGTVRTLSVTGQPWED